jgi:biopolymer transport protein ExbD
MALSVNGGNGFGSRGRRRGGSSLSEINVTPFVDVVLVLLIIFMLTAHVMDFGLQVDVPHVRQSTETNKELPVVSIKKDGTIYLNDKPANINELATTIRQRFRNATAVYLRADKETIYGPIAQVASMLGEAKLQVNLVTQPEDESDRGRR